MNDLFNNHIENNYSFKTDTKYRRALGQFFTPYKVAQFMSDWILGHKAKKLRILDPATGFGIFERALTERNKRINKILNYSLWEIDKKIADELTAITKQLDMNAAIYCSDFMTSDWKQTYDGIISNPPYYKHHYIKNKEVLHKEICSKTHFNFSLQTNIYCWFLIKSISLLSNEGRLAFIIPSEFLNSNYGEEVKDYLLQTGIILHLISISFDESVFDNALTTSVIVLGERAEKKCQSINFYNVTKIEQITDLNDFLKIQTKRVYEINDLDPNVKWRNYFNENYTNLSNKSLISFSYIGRFSRGIATGANNYFTLSNKEREIYKIPLECLTPCITKSSHVKDILFDQKEFASLLSQEKKVFLFDGKMSKKVSCLDYIKKGEDMGVDKVYLTRKRNPWFAVEKRKVSKIWVSVFGRSGLKFIWNKSNCLNLTCFHAFYPTEVGQKYLDILFIYLNTNLAKELLNREKREYGNGLEKFEPNDINKAMIFNFDLLTNESHTKLAKMQETFLISNSATRQKILAKVEQIFNKLSQ